MQLTTVSHVRTGSASPPAGAAISPGKWRLAQHVLSIDTTLPSYPAEYLWTMASDKSLYPQAIQLLGYVASNRRRTRSVGNRNGGRDRREGFARAGSQRQ